MYSFIIAAAPRKADGGAKWTAWDGAETFNGILGGLWQTQPSYLITKSRLNKDTWNGMAQLGIAVKVELRHT